VRSIIGRGPAVARNLKLFVWAFLVIIILTACGSGGGGGNSGSPGSQTITASFTPDVANPTDNSISLAQKSVQGDLITLRVTLKSLPTPSSGAAFDIEFDPNLVSFVTFAPGSFYETTGTVNYQAGLQMGTNNRLVVGITQQAGPGATGSGPLIELQFKALKNGNSALTSTNNNMIDQSGNLIPGIIWSGGTVTGS